MATVVPSCLHEKICEQQRFTILEVAADWHELMVLWRGMQTSIAHDSGLDWTEQCFTSPTTQYRL